MLNSEAMVVHFSAAPVVSYPPALDRRANNRPPAVLVSLLWGYDRVHSPQCLCTYFTVSSTARGFVRLPLRT